MERILLRKRGISRSPSLSPASQRREGCFPVTTSKVRAINNALFHSSRRWSTTVGHPRFRSKERALMAGIISGSWPANATLSKDTKTSVRRARPELRRSLNITYRGRTGTPPRRSRDARLLLTAPARKLTGRESGTFRSLGTFLRDLVPVMSRFSSPFPLPPPYFLSYCSENCEQVRRTVTVSLCDLSLSSSLAIIT